MEYLKIIISNADPRPIYEQITDELSKAQLALDYINSTVELEIPD